jgi:hypothetical protein
VAQRRIEPRDLLSQKGAARLDRTQLEGRACLLCAALSGGVALYPVGCIDGVQVFVCDCVGDYTVRHLLTGGEIRLAAGEINATIDDDA